MAEANTVRATFWRDSSGTCDCCGRTTRKMWGDLSDAFKCHAVCYVNWSVGVADHWPQVGLLIGAWGEQTSPSDRVHVALVYRPDMARFMVVDGEGRTSGYAELCSRSLKRDEVIGTSLTSEVFALADALSPTEPRIDEVRALAHSG